MISRYPMWMLLVTCTLLSSGFPRMAVASSEDWGNNVRSLGASSGELIISQAADESDDEDIAKPAVDRPTLKQGSSGPLVIQLQVLLQEQELYSGKISGDFDAETVAAVKAFQTANGLEPNGSVDSATWPPLTGEAVTGEEADGEELQPDSAEAVLEEGQGTAVESGEGNSDSKMRLLIAAAALLGLGISGFGLWRIFSVPVPQPLDYLDSEDEDYMDDLPDGARYSAEVSASWEGNPRDSSPQTANVVLPATAESDVVAIQSPQVIRIASGQLTEDLTAEQNLFSGLEELDEIDRPAQDGKLLEPVAKLAGDVKPSIVETNHKRVVKISKSVEQGLPQHQDKKVVQKEMSLSHAATEASSLSQPEFIKPAPVKAKPKSSQVKTKRRRKAESPTDAAVAIATQSARVAARQQSEIAPAQQVSAKTDTPVRNQASKTTGAKKSGRSQSSLSKPHRQQSGKRAATHAAPVPPPAPSKIARSTSNALEQPELVTNPLMARGDVVETLIVDLQGADPTKRRKAIWELGQRCDSRAIKPLVNLMTHSDSRQRSLILAALSEIGTQTLKPMKQALAMSLQDDNAEVRKNAIRDLTRIYELVAQISHLLNTALDDPDSEVQDTARWALKQLNRIRTNAGLEGNQAQPILQQSVSPPESFSAEETRSPKSLPNA